VAAVVRFPVGQEAALLDGERVRLEPLLEEHADDLEPVLADPLLHTLIGGAPADRDQLRTPFRRQAAGRSPDGFERWHNWLVRRRDDGRAVGTVQATVSEHVGVLSAEVAWLIGTAHQGQGYAKEAAGLMVAWLREQSVETLTAHVHPAHEASKAVARSIGLAPTEEVVDGEIRWQG
jgi:RimJ/RimL family protein N-acetyltransferase